ncbi:MAG: ABC transporter ATP-binding protein [Anaerolineales bacterium]|nr:ABC transporter ATP-binding protein [Anaerolineales bacterium]
MTTTPVVTLRNIQFQYNGSGSLVLKDFSLDITAGSVTSILGPNGSGKTTLLFVMLGMLIPQAGSVHFEGKPSAGFSRSALSRLIGLVPQGERVSFNFTVFEYVLMGRAPHLGTLSTPSSEDEIVARQSLEQAGLVHLQHRAISALSSGERQLVTIARALAQQPRILLLDEPLTHLDLNNRSRVLALLRVLNQNGTTLVLTTHDPNAAVSLATHVVMMRNGERIASGRALEVLTTANLSVTYGLPIEITHVGGRPVILPPG